MAAHSLKTIQQLPIPLDEAWEFFSNPANLPLITPPEMNFKIVSIHHGEKMYPGQIIEYKVSPIPGIRLYWMTEITQVKEKEFFIDEQRYGPYELWHHQHFFKAIPQGTEMTDIIHYKNPMGFIGRILNPQFVEPRIRKIFEFRKKKIEELFGAVS